VFQFKEYFESGAGADNFGEHTYIARELSNLAIVEFERVASRIANTEGVVAGRQAAADFARRQPIANEYYLRRSVADDLADSLPEEAKSAFAALGSITQTVESLSARLSIYMAFVPKQVRWQAELMLEDPTFAAPLSGALEDVDGINEAATRIAAIVDDSPALDNRLNDMVERVIGALQLEVAGLTEVVRAERELVLGKLPEEYEEIFGHVTQQRVAALEDVAGELERLVSQVDAIAARALTDADGVAQSTVDYAFARAMPLLIAAFFGLLILILVYRLVPPRVRTN